MAKAMMTNMVRGKRTYALPKVGDLFAISFLTGRRVFGRVVVADAPRELAPMPGANLLYIYADTADLPPDQLALTVDSLLIPPVWTNRKGWTLGYYAPIGHRALSAVDVLPVHRFRDHQGKYRDERGNDLGRGIEPCGEWGLVSYRWIDDRLSDALGIPRAPDTGGEN